jgi:hypothetical protein
VDVFPIIHPTQVDVNGNPIILSYDRREAGFKILDQNETIYSLSAGANFVIADNVFGEQYPGQNRISLSFDKALEGVFGSLTQEDIDLKALNTKYGVSPELGPIGDTRHAVANFWKLYMSYRRQQVLLWEVLLMVNLSGEYSNFTNIPSSFKYGGADTGTSGIEWNVSTSKSFAFAEYVDRVNVELGYKQQIAINTFIPDSAFDRDVQSCGGLNDLNAYERYQCRVSTPYIAVQIQTGSHFLNARYRSTLEKFETLGKKLTLSYTFLF